jgi:uncharacterized membrane protein YqjE
MMADLERTTATAPARAREPVSPEEDSLPSLFGRLGDDVMTLVDTKLSLMKVELKEDAAFYARGTALMAVGGAIATVGLALVNVAVAFFISSFFGNEAAGALTERFTPTSYGIGFLITGAIYLVIGGAIMLIMKNRIAAYNPVPARTLEEIRKDKQWLKNEM